MMFSNNFSAEIEVLSPGRINLIGEHIDYNGGYVLPAAIDKAIRFRFRKNDSDDAHIYSKNFDQSTTIPLKRLEVQEKGKWENYLIGVLALIEERRPKLLSGFDCIMESNLPLGSGLSSSAALECGLAKGLNALFQLGLSDQEIIEIGMKAEHFYVGTKCGVMDQFAVVMGKKDHFIQLNCQDLSYQLIKAELAPYQLVLLNSNVSHDLATSAYNDRRAACEFALNIIQKTYPHYRYLAEIDETTLAEFQGDLPPIVYQRAQFVVKEQERTKKAVKALQDKDFEALGALLYQTHQGLSQEYEVSCEEVDFLVESTKDLPEVLGSRIMGGGFGGCSLNLVHQDAVESFIEVMQDRYFNQFQKELLPIPVIIEDGVKIL
jgi:galactokinase